MKKRKSQKHSHIPHARVADPDFYYKIIYFTVFGYSPQDIATATGTPIQTVNRNFKVIRSKLANNQNFLTELFNRLYHLDKTTGDYYGQLKQEFQALQPAKDGTLTPEQKDRTERLVECLKECRLGKPPKKFMLDHVRMGTCNSYKTDIDGVFDPENDPYALYVPILQDIEGYAQYITKKKTCRACRLCPRDKDVFFEIFSKSQYNYIDIAYYLSRFHPKKLEDYSDHFLYAWIIGCMRGIYHMKLNKTEIKALEFEEQLQASNAVLLEFVDLAYDAIAGKMLPSLPFAG